MRIAIYGTGGIGGYYGGRLARAGEDVSFLARGDHLRALREGGLWVDSVGESFHLPSVRATEDPAEVGEVDLVLLGVKTWQVPEACARIAPLLGEDTAVLTLQNGVETPSIVAEAVGRERVLPGTAKIFASVSAPGRIAHAGGPASLTFAEWDGRPSDRVARLREVLSRAGVPVEVPEDIVGALWEKFLFVVPVGGVGAVARAPVGVIRSLPETRALLEGAMREIEEVARARGVALPDGIVPRSLDFVDRQPAAGISSLYRDVAAGRPSELDAWNGAVVRLGAGAGVPTPVNGTGRNPGTEGGGTLIRLRSIGPGNLGLSRDARLWSAGR